MHSASRGVPQHQGQGCAQKYRQDRAEQPSSPTYLQAERSTQRPSTPKGVGRVAPLTAAGRGAKLLGRSGQGSGCGTSTATSRGANGAAVKGANLASAAIWLGVAVEGVPRQLTTPNNHWTLNMSGDWWWSAAGGLMWLGSREGCGGEIAAGSGTVGERTEGCRGGGWKTKQGRNGVGLRLVAGWWSL